MNEKQWGITLIAVGILITVISMAVKIIKDAIYGCNGCSMMIYVIIWFIGSFIVVIGFLLFRSDELDNIIAESKLKINDEFKEAKKKERKKDEFQKFLLDFNDEEKEVIEIVHTFEGITVKKLEKEISFSKNNLETIITKLHNKKIIKELDNKLYLLKLS